MTRARIPHGAWPRGLSREQAAAYAGVSPNTFLTEVKKGLWPKPEARRHRKIWDRLAIDEAGPPPHRESNGAHQVLVPVQRACLVTAPARKRLNPG